MKKRTRAAFTLNLSDGPHKRVNAAAAAGRRTYIRIDVIHGRVSARRDELDHVIIDVILCKYIYYTVYILFITITV